MQQGKGGGLPAAFGGSGSDSPEFQVVIPKGVRESLGPVAGQQLQVVQYGDRTELLPVRDIGEMRGWLAGLDTRVEHEPDRPL